MSNILPVITLYQPWATWIMRGWKTIETRTHPRFACLLGKRVLIHSGMKTDTHPLTVNNRYLTRDQILFKPDEMINGYILGSAMVNDFRKLTGNASSRALIDCERDERWGLFLEKVSRWEEPVPVKGELGIWYFDIENKIKVKKPAA